MNLSRDEKLVILKAADEIIMQGGRSLLAKILKGSRDKKVLQHQLDKSPAYGAFNSETLAKITKKIDWMIENDFLDIEYSRRLPMIVFTSRGWLIQANQRATELLKECDKLILENAPIPNMEYLKDRNRHMIFLFLDKVRETADSKYIPFLEAWEKIDYKKVRVKIRETITSIEEGAPIDLELIEQREAELEEALIGLAPEDLHLKCWECGNRFVFTVGEQNFFKQKGFQLPKRCGECREERNY
ncbi:RQC-minor-1 family DNA-binding protein [Oceanobacillus sp. CAU 1775]